MVYPLSWLSEYVKLPTLDKDLTDRLTMMGHMLDKRIQHGKEIIIDLELRGNRPDLLGITGLAREIHAYFEYSLKLPPTKKLPPINKSSNLVKVKAPELLERFMAFPLFVKVKASPNWLKKKLEYYGIPSINNVVDITNYVMLETGEPMHAFDISKLSGKSLILRRARNGELFTPFHGQTVPLTIDDLVISDLKTPQGLTIIGSKHSGVTYDTTSIILEAAVYKYANVRRTARRLGIRTEAGTRHEKILDTNFIQFSLERAYYLLEELADAKPSDGTFDFYPNLNKPKTIIVKISDIERLTGTEISITTAKSILERLGCQVIFKKGVLEVETPTFRTDLIESADLIEEIIRIYGYERIPTRQLAGEIPSIQTSSNLLLEEKIRDSLINLHINEIKTSSIIADTDYINFAQTTNYFPPVKIINPPDVNMSTLRPSLLINLVSAAVKALNFRQTETRLFEIGKIFYQDKPDKYMEVNKAGFVIAKIPQEKNDRTIQPNIAILNGVVSGLFEDLGIEYDIVSGGCHPSLDTKIQGEIRSKNNQILGSVGLLHPWIQQIIKSPVSIFAAELNIEEILNIYKSSTGSYSIYPPYPPIVEDISFEINKDSQIGIALAAVKKSSDIISKVEVVDIFQNSRTIRITYLHPEKSLSDKDISPIRQKILEILKNKFDLKPRVQS